ncbi:putative mitogen-activated protein kinase [Arabidopsis thaliana]|uniref:Mitogen-activated protein kinase kinase kinase 3 n=1 Tax=Arabidopsis thaliana TaxID=3702 RepID=MP3K3_ARATH|nr:MAPK/ERK kinase kinase 3 [Arabidopsis thaliana]Q9M0T3.1 RecName: Full=Mitogen-activated protein kinase kinase kinase 3; Short=MAP kinase kinase kinase 3; AltName: Full=MAP3K beta 3 protein kinase; Short=MAP3K beta 3; AltName: Full=MAPK/ERK kinase kinase 3; Short=AtMEKK3 [Arabidopsis thaliana]AAX12872.1 At4g08470 [Arabidopsis thaliana]AEE82648.1 MAPK/ERK kinase kinase 3 [Arabidopsis thaliana]CAB77972.1 putative mitogen-activated protein kinase [Arabidopsis thaliana]|eukprot:NP_192587.1 MAPK/ERK kinase kinase 3 [Arabidopsis thaliana]
MDVTAIFAGDILVQSREYLIPNDVVDVDGGIKAVRPPIIQPPPGRKLPLIDFPGSSWDFLTYFAPSKTVKRQSSSSSDNTSDKEEVETEETRGMFVQLGDTAHEACPFATNEADSSSTVSIISPSYASRGSIVPSWLKRKFLGRVSLGFVYEGSSGSSVGSESTCSLMTPSLEFPDRISFRKKDFSEKGPSRHVWEKRKLTRAKLIENFCNPEDIEPVTSWLKGQLLGEESFASVYEAISDSSVGSESTCSLMTPSMEFPDRISFRKRDFSEEGPSGRVKEKRKLMRNKLIENFRKPEDITSWLKGQLLGRGSYASVYEAISEDGDFFAVKEVSLLDKGIQAQECIQQLEGEIALLSQLQHQNIVRYRGTAKDVSKLYIFLELVTQGSVQKLYERYQLSYTVVSLYTRQILAGLNYLHDKGFVHRDIKCANMLVDANGTVKLADFGLAEASKFNDIMSCKGTLFWMAPEVINRKDSDGNGSPADIWSLGCTVLEMCTGQIPYSDLKPIQAAFKIGRGTLPDVPDTLSLDARHFILTCLKVNPEERPTAAELLHHPFVINL